jgi:hypothetical protein
LIHVLHCCQVVQFGLPSWFCKQSACASRFGRFLFSKNKISDSNQKVAMVLASSGLE